MSTLEVVFLSLLVFFVYTWMGTSTCLALYKHRLIKTKRYWKVAYFFAFIAWPVVLIAVLIRIPFLIFRGIAEEMSYNAKRRFGGSDNKRGLK